MNIFHVIPALLQKIARNACGNNLPPEADRCDTRESEPNRQSGSATVESELSDPWASASLDAEICSGLENTADNSADVSVPNSKGDRNDTQNDIAAEEVKSDFVSTSYSSPETVVLISRSSQTDLFLKDEVSRCVGCKNGGTTRIDGNDGIDESNPVVEENTSNTGLDESNPVVEENAVNTGLGECNPVVEENTSNIGLYECNPVVEENAINMGLDESNPVVEENASNTDLDESNPVVEENASNTGLDESNPVVEENTSNTGLDECSPVVEENTSNTGLDEFNSVVEENTSFCVSHTYVSENVLDFGTYNNGVANRLLTDAVENIEDCQDSNTPATMPDGALADFAEDSGYVTVGNRNVLGIEEVIDSNTDRDVTERSSNSYTGSDVSEFSSNSNTDNDVTERSSNSNTDSDVTARSSNCHADNDIERSSNSNTDSDVTARSSNCHADNDIERSSNSNADNDVSEHSSNSIADNDVSERSYDNSADNDFTERSSNSNADNDVSELSSNNNTDSYVSERTSDSNTDNDVTESNVTNFSSPITVTSEDSRNQHTDSPLGSNARGGGSFCARYKVAHSSVCNEAPLTPQTNVTLTHQTEQATDRDSSGNTSEGTINPECVSGSNDGNGDCVQSPRRMARSRADGFVPQTSESDASLREDHSFARQSSSENNEGHEAGHFVANGLNRLPDLRIWDSGGLSTRFSNSNWIMLSRPRSMLSNPPTLRDISARATLTAMGIPWVRSAPPVSSVGVTPLRYPNSMPPPTPPPYILDPPQYTENSEDLPPAYSLVDPMAALTEASVRESDNSSVQQECLTSSSAHNEQQVNSESCSLDQENVRAETVHLNQDDSPSRLGTMINREAESQPPPIERHIGTERQDSLLDEEADCSTVMNDTTRVAILHDTDGDASSEPSGTTENESAFLATRSSSERNLNPLQKQRRSRRSRRQVPLLSSSNDTVHVDVSSRRAASAKASSHSRDQALGPEDNGEVFLEGEGSKSRNATRTTIRGNRKRQRSVSTGDTDDTEEERTTQTGSREQEALVIPAARRRRRRQDKSNRRKQVVFPIPFLIGRAYGRTFEEHRDYLTRRFGRQPAADPGASGDTVSGEVEQDDDSPWWESDGR